ncbi:MAG: 23S rRNA (pseudouridine(1915)-N(3))-methyltransferase RlmH [Proteobacteria bacterium]|nr:23S rRNA (pseudouridine(1915)-N(3))-methyltransferase RlmH [Pseudomonadota bacterium]MCL2309099.1 23S rRNA (pseudouridine(1915)-N(3))-methyltransferase RlmH [Pseudomonadota bacterium]
MRLKIIAFGQRLPGWMVAGVDDYLRRLPRDCRAEVVELKPEARDRGKTVAQMLAAEAARVEEVCATGAFLKVALDERGQRWDTRQLAQKLVQWRDVARDVAFILGSADGLDAALKASADAQWSLSPLTLPHGLARIVVAEQLYRAISLSAGHPYHRE